jgi:hypothetical protein
MADATADATMPAAKRVVPLTDAIRLTLEVTFAPGQNGLVGWFFNLDVDLDGGTFDGWITSTGAQSSMDGSVPYLHLGDSTLVHGTLVGSNLSIDPVSVDESHSRSFDTTAQLDALQLKWVGDGTVIGSARGTWLEFEYDMSLGSQFEAPVSGGVDLEAPSARVAAVAPDGTMATDATVLFPFEPVMLAPSEPIVVSSFTAVAKFHNGETSELQAEFTSGAWEGFANSVAVRPVGGWPAGEVVDLSIEAEDAAGNHSGDAPLGSVSIAAQLNTNSNLGFESLNQEWFGISTAEQEELTRWDTPEGSRHTVTPTEGTRLGGIVEDRAVAYLVPPADATELCFDAGFALQGISRLGEDGAVFDVGVFSTETQDIHHFGAADFIPYADANAGWSGFQHLCVPLLGSDGLWLSIVPIPDTAPLYPDDPFVLLDAFEFQ